MPFIRFELQREGSGYKESRSLENALTNVVECDLSFGGQATTTEDEKIVTETTLMGVKDVTTYEGTPEDMAILHQAILVHLQLDVISKRNYSKADFVPEEQGTFMERAMAKAKNVFKDIALNDSVEHIFRSGGRSKQIYMGMLQPQSEKEMMDLCSKSLKDVRALVHLKCIEKVAVEDFRALAYA